MKTAIYPERDASAGLTDRYSDVGVDASWQKTTGSNDVLSLQTSYTHESRNLRASCALGFIGQIGAPNCADLYIDEWRGDVGYHRRNKVGATIGAFSISGDSNPLVYDNRAAAPDSNGAIFQLNYSPWGEGNGPLANLQVGLQYTAYGNRLEE